VACCPDYSQEIQLEALGELSSQEDRRRLERHLQVCDQCREELNALKVLLGRIQDALPAPLTIPAESERNVWGAITRWLEESAQRNHEAGPLDSLWQRLSWRPLMAAAAAVLIIALGVAYLQPWRGTQETVSIEIMKQEERTIVENLDLLRNLELLESMDEVEALVRVLDKSSPPHGTQPDQGIPGARLRWEGRVWV
jgi:anti-sigma factor RsiW